MSGPMPPLLARLNGSSRPPARRGPPALWPATSPITARNRGQSCGSAWSAGPEWARLVLVVRHTVQPPNMIAGSAQAGSEGGPDEHGNGAAGCLGAMLEREVRCDGGPADAAPNFGA